MRIRHGRHGDVERGVAILQRGVELTRERDLPMGVRILTPVLGFGLARGGRLLDALRVLEPVAGAPLLPYCLTFVAEAYLLAGRLDEAGAIAARAIEQCLQRKEHAWRAWAEWTLGRVESLRGPRSGAALVHFRHALELAEERDMRPLVAHCHRGIGELGPSASSQQASAKADRLYREMNMAPRANFASTVQLGAG